jgi:hypothetical protein
VRLQRKHFLKAIEDWNHEGADAFRKRHGKTPRRGTLAVGGKRYDLTPILAAVYSLAYPKSTPRKTNYWHSDEAVDIPRGRGLTVINTNESEPQIKGAFNPKARRTAADEL